ncbi:hypothetical protein R0137_13405 [Congregibacter brevis]|uniref:Uncharacterized protein n=1 Tax=Congregibacter brevis TaxID=3081201 RepID=A0ABZ0IAT2_9GAMM|nr:hypothetical protein R0137_13405 [Congregibacter sp. IMCC45268]
MQELVREAQDLPSWFVAPGEGDFLFFVTLIILLSGLYALVFLYAAFDRWAERQSDGTPLAKTIPTLLAIALIYEVFPLSHFNALLPLAAILIALMADWSRFHLRKGSQVTVDLGNAPTSNAGKE